MGRRLLPDRGAELGRRDDDGLALQVLRLRRRRLRGRGRRLHRRLRPAPRRHRARRRRQPLAAGRPRAGRGRVRAGRGVADVGGPAVGHHRRASSWAADDPGRVDVQAAELLGDADRVQRRAARARPRGRRGLRLQGRRRAAADAGVLGARGAARGVRGVRAPRASRSSSPRPPRRRRCTGRSTACGSRQRSSVVEPASAAVSRPARPPKRSLVEPRASASVSRPLEQRR